MSAAAAAEVEGFTASRERFGSVLAFLDGAEAAAVCHAELEERLQAASRRSPWEWRSAGRLSTASAGCRLGRAGAR